jgi:hypothetical protein
MGQHTFTDRSAAKGRTARLGLAATPAHSNAFDQCEARMLQSGASFDPGLPLTGSAPIQQARILWRVPASSLAQVHKHPHNCRSHDNAGFEPGSGEAALRRSASANLAGERRENALVRPYSCLKSGGLYLPKMSQFGSAFRNSSTPASVTFVPRRNKTCKLFSPASSFSPASVISVPLRSAIAGSSVPPVPSAPRPLSLAAQVEPLQVLQCCQFLQPRVRYLRAVQVQPLQVLQSGQFLQPRVGYLRAAQVQPLQVLQSGQFLQPRVGYLRAASGSAIAGSSVRPVPSAPRRLSSCRQGSAIAGSSVRPVPSAPRRLSSCRARSSHCRFFSPASSFSPASVICVPCRSSHCRFFSPASSFSPASVIFVAARFSHCRFFSPPVPSAPRRLSACRQGSALQVLQSGQFLQPRVRYLRAARFSVCRFFSPPVPSAPRRLSACCFRFSHCRFFSSASSFSPASVIFVWPGSALQVLQFRQFLQPRVRYRRVV